MKAEQGPRLETRERRSVASAPPSPVVRQPARSYGPGVAMAPNKLNGYETLDADMGEAQPASPREAQTPGGSRLPKWDRGLNSLDDLAGFFQTAITELRSPHPVEAARKLRERVKEVTEVHIHRDKKKTAEIETIDYMPQDSEMYRKWLHTQPLHRLWDRWMMMFLVGFVVGSCAFCLHVLFSTLAITKVRGAAGHQRHRRLRFVAGASEKALPHTWLRALPTARLTRAAAACARRRTRCATSSPRTCSLPGCSTWRTRCRSSQFPQPPSSGSARQLPAPACRR